MVLRQVPVTAEIGVREILAPIPAAGRVFFTTAETSQRTTRSDISHKEFPLCLQVKRTPSCFASETQLQFLLTGLARFKDKELFCFGVRIQDGWLAALASVPSRNRGAAVSVTAAYVEAPHRFPRAVAERALAHAAHNPLSCIGVADAEQGSFASPKKTMTEKRPGSAFPFAKRRRDGGSRGKPLPRRDPVSVPCGGQAVFLLPRDVFGMPWMEWSETHGLKIVVVLESKTGLPCVRLLM